MTSTPGFFEIQIHLWSTLFNVFWKKGSHLKDTNSLQIYSLLIYKDLLKRNEVDLQAISYYVGRAYAFFLFLHFSLHSYFISHQKKHQSKDERKIQPIYNLFIKTWNSYKEIVDCQLFFKHSSLSCKFLIAHWFPSKSQQATSYFDILWNT